MEVQMNLKNTAKLFLTLLSIFLVCASYALASDQVQHQTGTIDELKNKFNTLLLYGEVLISEVSYKINHLTNTNAEGNNVTTQADLDFWNKLKAQYPFSEKPVFISRNSVCRPAYDYVPTGVSEVTIMDNSGNALDSYTVTKTETGFTIQKGATGNPDQSYTITLNKLEELDATYGNIGQIRDGEMYIKEQIQSRA
jgi:opacity protein-like surface antigen